MSQDLFVLLGAVQPSCGFMLAHRLWFTGNQSVGKAVGHQHPEGVAFVESDWEEKVLISSQV